MARSVHGRIAMVAVQWAVMVSRCCLLVVLLLVFIFIDPAQRVKGSTQMARAEVNPAPAVPS